MLVSGRFKLSDCWGDNWVVVEGDGDDRSVIWFLHGGVVSWSLLCCEID